MEIIRDSITKELPPLRLHIDDVQEMYDFVTEYAEDVELTAAGYRLESCNELRELPFPHIHRLTISASEPFIHVQLTEHSADIHVGSGDVEAEGIAARLEKILKNARAPVYFVSPGFFGWIIASITLWVGFLLSNIPIMGVGVAILLADIILVVIDGRFRLNSYCTVLPVERKEQSSFWQRNKDQIGLIAIGGVIGALLTMLADKLLELF